MAQEIKDILGEANNDAPPENTFKLKNLGWVADFLGLALPALAIILSIHWLLNGIEKNIKNIIKNSLETVLQTTQEGLNLWHENHHKTMTNWASSPFLLSAVQDLVKDRDSPETLRANPALKKLRDLLLPELREHGFLDFLVFSQEHVILASMNDPLIGQKVDSSQYGEFLSRVLNDKVLTVQSGIFDDLATHFYGHLKKDVIPLLIAAPVRGDSSPVIAALVLFVDAGKDRMSMLYKGRLGQTGETYAFDKSGKMVSVSRFEEQLHDVGLLPEGTRSLLNMEVRDPGGNLLEGFRPAIPRERQPLTLMAREAVAGKSGYNLEGYRDYRGVPVIGAWLWDKHMEIGIATEVDKAEIYKPYYEIKSLAHGTATIILVLFIGYGALRTQNSMRLKNLLEKVRESEALNSMLMENAVDGIIIIDEHGDIRSFNSAAERLFFYTKSEVMGKNILMLIPDSYAKLHKEGFNKLIRTGESKILGKVVAVSGLRKDGSTFPHELAVSQTISKGICVFIGIIRDITERTENEELLKIAHKQIISSEKLAGIGQLAAGVSHEILNPLNIISIHVQMLQRSKAADPDLLNILSKIRNEINRIEKINRALLTFSRKTQSEFRTVKIETELNAIFNLLYKEFELENIKIVKEISSDAPDILADPDELRQVFLNIITNAQHAMPAGGILTIRVKPVDVNGIPHARIELEDTGSGISEKNLEQIFTPFFTTKEEGKGTGLGLSVAHTLVEKHGGTIRVESEEGKWTRLVIDLPCGGGG